MSLADVINERLAVMRLPSGAAALGRQKAVIAITCHPAALVVHGVTNGGAVVASTVLATLLAFI